MLKRIPLELTSKWPSSQRLPFKDKLLRLNKVSKIAENRTQHLTMLYLLNVKELLRCLKEKESRLRERKWPNGPDVHLSLRNKRHSQVS